MTDAYNASDTRSIRRAAKAAKQALAERQTVVLNLMSSPTGRNYMYDRLVRCHIFSSSFNVNALGMAFAEGERNVGLQDLTDIMQFAPDQYIAMMREASDKEQANGRRSNDDNDRHSGDHAQPGRPDNGRADNPNGSGIVDHDYDPGLDGEDAAH